VKNSRLMLLAGLSLWLGLTVAIVALGQPDPDERYRLRAAEYEPRIRQRTAQIAPGELLSYMYDTSVELHVLDVRSERDFNLFHLRGAELTSPESLERWYRAHHKPNRLLVVVSNDEAGAVPTWRRLVAMKVGNVYLLEGGLNGWLRQFSERRATGSRGEPGALAFSFGAALGERYPEARPSRVVLAKLKFEKKVKMKTRARKGGGCG
jgi:rhodanese-related sulfurtransferase